MTPLPLPGAMPNPTQDGIYAAEVYFGWKLLEWKDARWNHVDSGRWPLEVAQWVGPLPALVYYDLCEKRDAAQEYDL